MGAILWGLSVVAGLATTLSRPEGSVAAALIALGGLSLRSHSMRPLMWSKGGSMSGVFIQMLAEVLLMGVSAGGCSRTSMRRAAALARALSSCASQGRGVGSSVLVNRVSIPVL